MKIVSEIFGQIQNYSVRQWTNGLIVILAVWIYLMPSPIDPKPYTYPVPLPSLEGPLKKNVILQHAERFFQGQIKGPESFAVDRNGTIYTGGSDGRIFAIKNHNLTLVSRTGIEHPLCGTFELEPRCGRPKGMKVGPDGHLYIVDAYKGLLKFDLGDFSLHTLINSGKGLGGIPFKFLNGLEISSDGIIYFTDSSTKWDRRNHKYEVLETHQEGRVLSYNIYTGEASTLLTGLYLANGIALSKDETFLIISEMSVARIRRFYIKGPRAGDTDVFIDNLPGYPDNIKINAKGNFYVGMASVRFEGASPIGSFLDIVGPYPAVKRFIAKVTPFYVYNIFLPRHAMVIELSHDGVIVGSLQDPGAIKIAAVSEAYEYNGTIYIGHFESPYLGTLDTTKLDISEPGL